MPLRRDYVSLHQAYVQKPNTCTLFRTLRRRNEGKKTNGPGRGRGEELNTFVRSLFPISSGSRPRHKHPHTLLYLEATKREQEDEWPRNNVTHLCRELNGRPHVMNARAKNTRLLYIMIAQVMPGLIAANDNGTS